MLLDINSMTIEQKLGMVFCARRFVDRDQDSIEFTIELIKKRALGCVQFPPERQDFIDRVLAEADYPILVFCDTEQGYPASKLPQVPALSLAACSESKYYGAFARCMADDARKAGFNGTWGPVIDVLQGDGPIIVSRVFSDDPLKVAECSALISEECKKSGYLSTGKHYPGSGGERFDTHMTEGACEMSREEIEERYIAPYVYLMERDLLPCIMTSHIVYPAIDPEYPASLSKKCIDILRNKGFDGISFTDSFAMMGVLQKFGEENIYGMAVAAGNDIILPNYRTPTREVFAMIKKNFEDGAFSMERLDEAVRRVLTAMEFAEKNKVNANPATEEDKALLYDIARDCITAVCDDGVSAKLTGNDSDRLFVIVTENNYVEEEPNPEISFARWYDPTKIAEKIHEEFPSSGIAFLPEFPGYRDNDRVLTEATGYKEVVFITFCTAAAYLGTDGLTRRVESVINCLINSKKVSAVVHFGNPYALTPLDHVSRKIFGYNITESQLHAIDVLAGKLEAKGKLPFDIDFN